MYAAEGEQVGSDLENNDLSEKHVWCWRLQKGGGGGGGRGGPGSDAGDDCSCDVGECKLEGRGTVDDDMMLGCDAEGCRARGRGLGEAGGRCRPRRCR